LVSTNLNIPPAGIVSGPKAELGDVVTDVRNGLFLATEPTLFACLSDLPSPAGIVSGPKAELEDVVTDVRNGLFLATEPTLFACLSDLHSPVGIVLRRSSVSERRSQE
jgi:hypothetical protein